jgi:hypothetical protein
VKKFVIAVAAVFALVLGTGTASAGHYHNYNNVQVVRVVRNVQVDACDHANVAVVADDYVAPVQVRKVVRIVNVNANAYDYSYNGVGGRNARFARNVRVENGGGSGVVGVLKAAGRTVGNLVGDIIGN